MPERDQTAIEESTLRTGSRWLTAAFGLVGLLNHAYALLLTYLLSAGDYSAFAAAQALLLVVGTLAGSSVPWVVAHRLAAPDCTDPQERMAVVSFGFLASAVAGAVTAVAVAVVGAQFLGLTALALTALTTFLLFVSTTPLGWLQGTGRYAPLARLKVVEVAVKIAAGAGLGALGWGVSGAILGFAGGAFVVLLLGCWRMREELSLQRPNLRLTGLLRMSLGMTALQGVLAVMIAVDVVLVAVLPVPDGQAATYQAAAVLAKAPLFVASAIAVAVFPLLGGSRSAADLAGTALRMYVSLTVPVVAVTMTIPAAVVALVLPSGYEGVTALLPVLAPAGAAVGLLTLDATLLQAQERYRVVLTRLVPGLALVLVTVVVGWEVAGASGMAAGACAAAVGNAFVLRRATAGGVSGARRTQLKGLVVGLLLLAVLVLIRDELVLWLLVSAASGVMGLVLFTRGQPSREPEDVMTDQRSLVPDLAVAATARAPERRSASAGGAAGASWAYGQDHVPGEGGRLPRPIVAVRTAITDGDRESSRELEVVELPPVRYVVLSPHLDDAVLSCGSLLLAVHSREDVTITTVFTEQSEPYSLSGRAFLGQCGYRSRGAELYEQRRAEDVQVMNRLGIRWGHAGLPDALFRKKPMAPRQGAVRRLLPELDHVYPTYRFHVARGHVSAQDRAVVRRVRAMAEPGGEGPTVVLAPLGIGGHVDHVLVRDAAARSAADVVYYADVPYSASAVPDPAFVEENDLLRVVLRPSGVGQAQARRELVEGYATQCSALFPDGVPDIVDEYYVPRRLLEVRE